MVSHLKLDTLIFLLVLKPSVFIDLARKKSLCKVDNKCFFMLGSFFQKLFGTHLEVSVPHTKGLPVTDENKFGEEAESAQWIGVDLDGTLAEAEPWQGFDYIGKPVPMMMKRLKIWLDLGYRVKIVTARAQNPELAIPPIQTWLKKHGLPELEITNAKDMDMIELWDDRCVQVIPNTGRPVGPNSEPYRRT